jgi:fructose-1,6-bisphosphatase/inositol monophosphatase family enzyme
MQEGSASEPNGRAGDLELAIALTMQPPRDPAALGDRLPVELGSATPVTDADRAAERAIRAWCPRAPDDGVLGEEEGYSPH